MLWVFSGSCPITITECPPGVGEILCSKKMYHIARYIGGNNIWWIARKRKKIAIGGYKFGGYGTIATPSPGIGTILADLILAV